MEERRPEEGLRSGSSGEGAASAGSGGAEVAAEFPIWFSSRSIRSTGSQSGRAHGTSRSSANSSKRNASKRFYPQLPDGAAGKIGKKGSTGRCSPATASRDS